MRIVKVDWFDSSSGAWEWSDKDSYTIEPKRCFSVGIVIGEDRHCIKLVQTENDDCYLHAIAIPRGCIDKITPLDNTLTDSV